MHSQSADINPWNRYFWGFPLQKPPVYPVKAYVYITALGKVTAKRCHEGKYFLSDHWVCCVTAPGSFLVFCRKFYAPVFHGRIHRWCTCHIYGIPEGRGLYRRRTECTDHGKSCTADVSGILGLLLYIFDHGRHEHALYAAHFPGNTGSTASPCRYPWRSCRRK